MPPLSFIVHSPGNLARGEGRNVGEINEAGGLTCQDDRPGLVRTQDPGLPACHTQKPLPKAGLLTSR
jgi:hypothetical protein